MADMEKMINDHFTRLRIAHLREEIIETRRSRATSFSSLTSSPDLSFSPTSGTRSQSNSISSLTSPLDNQSPDSLSSENPETVMAPQPKVVIRKRGYKRNVRVSGKKF